MTSGVLPDGSMPHVRYPERGGFVYFITDGDGVKIGYSHDPRGRLNQLQNGCSRSLKLLGNFPGTLDDEEDLQRHFREARIHGEWFKPHTVLEFIKKLEAGMTFAEAKDWPLIAPPKPAVPLSETLTPDQARQDWEQRLAALGPLDGPAQRAAEFVRLSIETYRLNFGRRSLSAEPARTSLAQYMAAFEATLA